MVFANVIILVFPAPFQPVGSRATTTGAKHFNERGR